VSNEQPIDLDDLRRVAVKVRWMTDDNWLADMVELAAAEIARLREERRWVSVGERLPEDNVGVLAWGPCNGGAEMVWREHGKWHLSFVGTYIPDSTYTHWMPLPPGPEGDG
jgi:hypothetical protein